MLIFAHRGASGYAPENTLAAFDKALALSAEAIELDVHNVEGELMVFHDRQLAGKSNGRGLIHQQTLENLSKLSVQGEPIPSLWQVLTLVAARCIVNIELKGIGCVAPFIAMYTKAIEELNFKPEQLLASSFNHLYLAQVKHTLPQCHVAPLLAGVPLNLAQVGTELNAYSINLDIGFINQALITDAHARGLKVYVYTVDDGDDIRALKHLNVDGIFSNYPDKAKLALTQNPKTNYRHWFE
jgi:glycerophosphoryl diester phosphodiesterase